MGKKHSKRHDYPTPLRDRHLERVMALYEAGESRLAIAKKVGVSYSVVQKWINFATSKQEAPQRPMARIKEEPRSIDMQELSTLPAEEQIARLKEALRRSELKADLYEEIINVAEAKFKISIRKKAGAKQ